MKKTLYIILFLSLSSCFTEPKKEKEPYKNTIQKTDSKIKLEKKKSLELLKSSVGKYPSDFKLFENPIFLKRLKKLIGNRYDFLIDYWNIETPIEFKNEIYIIKGCEQHNCNWTNFIVTYDLTNNHLSVGIREEKKVKIFSEKKHHPFIIDEWKKEE